MEQIEQTEREFYGADSSEEELPPNPSVGDDDELLSLSEDEASTRQGISSMSMPTGSTISGPSVTPAPDEEEITREFEEGCGCAEKCYEKFSVSEIM